MPVPTLTDATIRAAIRDVFNQYAPTCVCFPWHVLGAKRDQWPGKLRSASDAGSDGKPRVHAYVFTRIETAGDWKTGNCARNEFAYEIWGFHYYDTGTQTANSDLTFNAELDTLRYKFNDLNLITADLPTQAETLSERLIPLSWRVDTDVFGGELLHFAIGNLIIEAK